MRAARDPCPPQVLSQLKLAISDMADAAVVGSLAVRFAAECGFPRREALEIAIAARELATNVVKHSGGEGQIDIGFDGKDLVIRVIDDGPGMTVPELLVSDDRQSLDCDWAKGLKQGGAAVRRLMGSVFVRNRPAGGLEVLAVKRMILGEEGL